MKILFLILIPFLVFSSACQELEEKLENSPKNVAEKFQKSLCAGDIEQAMKYLSDSQEFPRDILKIGLTNGYEDCKQKGGFDSFEIRTEHIIEGKFAIVRGQMHYKNLWQQTSSIELNKENDVWRIVSVD